MWGYGWGEGKDFSAYRIIVICILCSWGFACWVAMRPNKHAISGLYVGLHKQTLHISRFIVSIVILCRPCIIIL